jgi:hypothetical protein
MIKKKYAGVGNRYIVTRDKKGGMMHVSNVLKGYPSIEIIDCLDESTVLVEMTENERHKISREHPELGIERNELYQFAH